MRLSRDLEVIDNFDVLWKNRESFEAAIKTRKYKITSAFKKFIEKVVINKFTEIEDASSKKIVKK